MAYIKLGPKGDYFASARLGLYLSGANASYIDDSILYGVLRNFLLTGFFVLIEKHEFDNIKIDRRELRNIPLQYVGVNQPTIIEPILDIKSEPPNLASTGDRYLVWSNPTGEWAGYKGYIAEFDGSSWIFHTPKNGWTIPVYNLGISIHYSGTYPSGTWDITDNEITQLHVIVQTPEPGTEPIDENWATRTWVLQQILLETTTRIAADNYLLTLINNLTQNTNYPKAFQVEIADEGDYFEGTNVELALQELGSDLKGVNQNLTQLTQLYNNLNTIVQQLISNNNQNGTLALMYLDTDIVAYGHGLGYIPNWGLYEFIPDGSTTIGPNLILKSVVAQADVTLSNITISFPKKHNLVLILGR